VPDSPKMSWGALMRQKKAEKEQGIARLVRVKHAVLVIQVGGDGRSVTKAASCACWGGKGGQVGMHLC
jgi:hypothetical protein